MAKVAHGIKINYDAPIPGQKTLFLKILGISLIAILGLTSIILNNAGNQTMFDKESVQYQRCEKECYMNSHDIESCLNYCRMKYINKGERR